jgi:class 3 adenylate cyclase
MSNSWGLSEGWALFVLWLQMLTTAGTAFGGLLLWRIYRRTGNGDTLRMLDVKRGVRSEADRIKFLKWSGMINVVLQREKRSCFLLSVDIVGSRELKSRVQPTYADVAFIAYQQWIDGILTSASVWNQAWTPDGLMAVFVTADEAAFAAKRILCGLDKFNDGNSFGDAKFKLRCGVAWGKVLIFDDSEVERISDPSIDLAGHLQKEAPENSLLIASIAHANLHTQRDGFKNWGTTVDNVTAPLCWQKSRENCENI